jgi:hypothetical protein
VDLEEVLIQVMNDEFDVAVDDESAADVADLIMDLNPLELAHSRAILTLLLEFLQHLLDSAELPAIRISDMLADRPETDAVDLEEVLIQVMNDEFDVAVD